MLLSYRQTSPVHIQCDLDLGTLYPTKAIRNKFRSRFSRFIKSDPYAHEIYGLDKDNLSFKSEQLVPEKDDGRKPLLFVFGNPASHSVVEGMFFSFEGHGREHRFWKDILYPAGVVEFPFHENCSTKERNQIRKKALIELDYKSKYRIGLSVFISFPSPASGPWSGIAGIQKLFGAKAMKTLEKYEQARIADISMKFLREDGAVCAFQKNAWQGLRGNNDPEYSIALAKSAKLIGRMGRVPLLGIPPTRLAGPAKKVLSQFLQECF